MSTEGSKEQRVLRKSSVYLWCLDCGCRVRFKTFAEVVELSGIKTVVAIVVVASSRLDFVWRERVLSDELLRGHSSS